MSVQSLTFEDFHVHGASAPEWKQRYLQITPGAMRSSLAESRFGSLHVFHKWMSQRVVQQGCLPAGQICFGVVGTGASGVPRIQGRELLSDSYFVLQADEEFLVQRPAGLEVLSVTFDVEEFRRMLDEQSCTNVSMASLSRSLSRSSARPLRRLRRALLSMLRSARRAGADQDFDLGPNHSSAALAFELIVDVLHSSMGLRQSARSASASSLVARCHLFVDSCDDGVPSIEALCLRLNISRRTLQNSFAEVANTTPVRYLRAVRLDGVRRQLLFASSRSSVTQAAMSRGFTHLSHFSERYYELFGELPSQTLSRRADLAKGLSLDVG